jgi:DNA-binding CsgD family transcriptional regulator
VAQGLSYKAAAAELAITPATLRHQMHQAYAKLGVKSKSELAAAWHLRGLPTPPGRLKGH